MVSSSRTAYHWLIPAGTAAFLLATAVLSKPFHYDLLHVVLLGALYGLVALLLYLPLLLALRWAKLPAFIATAAAAFVLVLHFREQTRPSGTAESLDKPDVLVPFLLAWLVVAVLYFVALLALVPREAPPPALLPLLAGVPLFFGLLMLCYYPSNTLRWHLLRHNTFLGALSYHLFAEDTAWVRAALWEDNAAELPPLPPEVESTPSPAGAPDIVFVLIDTMRRDALAATGGEGGQMPFIDDLAARSAVFTDVKVNASWTFPSMASMFTGLLPEEHGAVWQSALGEDKVTLAEELAARGYRTAAFIANAAWMRANRGMAQGFEEFRQLGSGGAIYPRAEEVNAAVFEWLDASSDRGAPNFLYVHYMDPHVPYLAAGVIDPASHEIARAAYQADLRYLDGQLRALMDGLAARLDGRRYTIMVADHGEEFGEHGERGHGRALYDEVLRVPALLNASADGSSAVVDVPLEGRDFFSLTLALAAPEPIDVRAWADEHARTQRYASTYYTNRSVLYRLLRPYRADICLQAIEMDGYTLIWSGQGNTWELYDLRADPRQLHNIADREPQVVSRLAAAMRAAPRYWTPEVAAILSDDDLERLRALGYLR